MLLALLLHVPAEDELHDDSCTHKDERYGRVVCDLGGDDLLHGLCEGRDAGIEHDHCDDRGSQILDAAVSQRVLLVWLLVGKLRACNRDDRGQGIREVVHRIEHDCNGVRCKAYGCLHGSERHVGSDADDARADNGRLSLLGGHCCVIHQSTLPSRSFVSIRFSSCASSLVREENVQARRNGMARARCFRAAPSGVREIMTWRESSFERSRFT